MGSNGDWSGFFGGGGGSSHKKSSSGGGWSGFFSGGGGSSRGSGKSKALKDAEATGDKGLMDRVQSVLGRTGHGTASLLSNALHLAAVPGLAVVNTTEQAGLELRKLRDHDAPGGSLAGIVQGIRESRGVGDVLEDNTLTKGQPLWLKRVEGFTGDVATDPLTWYTGGGGKIAEGGGKASRALGAGEKALEAGEKASRVTKLERGFTPLETLVERLDTPAIRESFGDEAVDKAVNSSLERKSIAAAPREMRRAAGVTTGAAFGTYLVPGTERLAELTAGRARQGLGKITNPVVSKLVDKGWADRLARTETREGSRAVQSRTELGYLKAHKTRLGKDVGSAGERAWAHDSGNAITAMEREAGEADRDLIRRAMEEPETLTPTEAASKEAATGRQLRQFFDAGKQRLYDETGIEIGEVTDYLPHRISPEYRELLGKAAASKAGSKEALQISRKLEGSIDQIHAALVEKYGDDAVMLFKTDPFELARQWSDEVGRLIKRGAPTKTLIDNGVLRTVPDAVVAANKEARQLASQATRAENRLPTLLERAGVARENAAQAVDDALTAGDQKFADALDMNTAADQFHDTNVAGLRDDVAELGARRDEARSIQDVLDNPDVGKSPLDVALEEARRINPAGLDKYLDEIVAPAEAEVADAVSALAAARKAAGGEVTEDVTAASIRVQEAQDRLLAARSEADLVTIDAAGIPVEMLRPSAVKDAGNPASWVRPRPDLSGMGLPRRTERRLMSMYDAHKAVTKVAASMDSMMAALNDAPEVVAANRARLDELEKQLAAGQKKLRGVEKKEASMRGKAQKLFRESEKEKNKAAKLVARLEGVAAVADADAIKGGAKALDLRALANDAAGVAQVANRWNDGLRELVTREGLWAEPEVAEMVERMTKLATPKETGALLKIADTVMSRWRAYALLSPGYHARNELGGVMNNALGSVDTKMYYRWERAWRQFIEPGRVEARRLGYGRTSAEWAEQVEKHASLDAIKDPEMRNAVEAYLRSDAGEGVRDVSDVLDRGASTKGVGQLVERAMGREPSKLVDRLDPTSMAFAPIQWNFNTASRVESHLRGVMFADQLINKAATAEEAVRMVKKFHFDYSELSQAERETMKRVFAFYTWSRKNFPLQIEMMWRRPAAYTTFMHAKQNLEHGTPDEQVVPSYFGRLLAIHTPWQTTGSTPGAEPGADIYLTPDLPFISIQDQLTPDSLGASLSPLIKTPIESYFGQTFFSGAQLNDNKLAPAPKSWLPILPVMAALRGVPGMPNVRRVKGPDGNKVWAMSQKDAYKIESAMPLLGRLRRLAPSEPKYQSRAFTSWLSFFGGIGARVNDQASQEGELASRNREVSEIVNKWYADHPGTLKPGSRKAQAAALDKLRQAGW